MGCLVFIIALFNTIVEIIEEKCSEWVKRAQQKRNENIDFSQIDSVTLDGVETAYRTETREEFDIVMSDYLTQQDGWQHYETQTVEYEVEDGVNYCFTIRYHNGTEIQRIFHESSPLTQRLLTYCE